MPNAVATATSGESAVVVVFDVRVEERERIPARVDAVAAPTRCGGVNSAQMLEARTVAETQQPIDLWQVPS